MRLVLASASPRRLELLKRAGLAPEVVAADVDEAIRAGEGASDYVIRVAGDKARAVATLHPDSVVIAADTAVVLDGRALGKPTDSSHADKMLRALAGRSHHVVTAVHVLGPARFDEGFLDSAVVTMVEPNRRVIEWYVSTGEPFDKAGAYALQGGGVILVERLDGDPTTVIGLPLRRSLELLVGAGVQWP